MSQPVLLKNKYVGPRTKGKPKDGKVVRIDEHGFDEFSDYFTDNSCVNRTVVASFHVVRSRKSLATVNANASPSIASFTVQDAQGTINRHSSILFKKRGNEITTTDKHQLTSRMSEKTSANHELICSALQNAVTANGIAVTNLNDASNRNDINTESVHENNIEGSKNVSAKLTVSNEQTKASDAIENIEVLSPILPTSQFTNQVTSTPFIRKRPSSFVRSIITFRDDNSDEQQQQISNEHSIPDVQQDVQPIVTLSQQLDMPQPSLQMLQQTQHTLQLKQQTINTQQTPQNLIASAKSTKDPLVETAAQVTRQQSRAVKSNRALKLKKGKISNVGPRTSPKQSEEPSTSKSLLPSFNTSSVLHYHDVANPSPFPIIQEKRKIFVPLDESKDDGLRRSKRQRVAPLQWYKNERVSYKWTPDGFEINGIIPPVNATPKPAIKNIVCRFARQAEKNAKKRKVKHKKCSSSINESKSSAPEQSELSAHVPIDTFNNSYVISTMVNIIDKNTRTEVPYECFLKYNENAFMNCQTKEPAQKGDPLIMLRGLVTPNYCAGILEIRPFQEKNMQFVKSDLMFFNISYGKLEVTIHESPAILNSGDCFVIPPGNRYSIRNLRNDTARLTYFNMKNYSV